jgi:hypothetical protein
MSEESKGKADRAQLIRHLAEKRKANAEAGSAAPGEGELRRSHLTRALERAAAEGEQALRADDLAEQRRAANKNLQELRDRAERKVKVPEERQLGSYTLFSSGRPGSKTLF